jgi:hypothetical protein
VCSVVLASRRLLADMTLVGDVIHRMLLKYSMVIDLLKICRSWGSILKSVILPIQLHNEEVHGLYSSPIIVRVIKARRMRWAGHVARIG